MTKRLKPEALFFSDGDGMFTFRANTIEEAIIAMQEAWNDDPKYYKEKYGDIIFTSENIREDVAYYHRICGYYSIGENICGECGEQTYGNGRKTFVINF